MGRKILKEFNYECYRDRIVRVIFPLFKKTVTFDFVYILSSADIDQSAPNFGKIFISNRIWMSLVMGLIELEQLELFSVKLWKIAAFDIVYSLTSTNINQSTPNLVTMNMSIRSRMSLIMGLVIPDQLVLSVLEVEKLNFSSLFGIYLHYQPVLLSTQVSDVGRSWSSYYQISQVVLFQIPSNDCVPWRILAAMATKVKNR